MSTDNLFAECDNCGVPIRDTDVNNAVYVKVKKRLYRYSVYCSRLCCQEDNRVDRT
jgi:hypothetical protein